MSYELRNIRDSESLDVRDVQIVLIRPDGLESVVPVDDDNRDYQEYAAWVGEGHTAPETG